MISSKEKALAILAYFGPLFLLAVLLAPRNPILQNITRIRDWYFSFPKS